MNNMSPSRKNAIRRNEPIEVCGLALYPIKVSEYEEFSQARAALECMLQSLPAQFAVLPFMQALFAADMASVAETGQATGLFGRLLLFLALSLRIGVGREATERVRLFELVTDKGDPSKLLALRFIYDGTERWELTPAMFNKMRPVMAAQNGLELPDETANLELIEAERDLASIGAPNLVYDFDAQLAAVASAERTDESEIMDWTVRKFYARFKAIDLRLRFLVCGFGDMSGNIKWKHGNPVPSWCFERVHENRALIRAGDFAGGNAVKAINDAFAQGETTS